MGFFEAFDRPFDPVADGSYTGIGIETLRDSIGRTRGEPGRRRRGGARRRRARPHDAGGAAPDPGRGRPPPLVAPGRRGARRRLGALLGVRRAARLRRAHRLHERRRPGRPRGPRRAGRRRRTTRSSPTRSATTASAAPPADQLLTGLRGKDVLLVFVESYGRVAVEDSVVLAAGRTLPSTRGTKRLQAAGFSARSGFLTSSTFGGLSWLAHSTLQSGVWVDNQLRYDQLVESDRFTLSQARSSGPAGGPSATCRRTTAPGRRDRRSTTTTSSTTGATSAIAARSSRTPRCPTSTSSRPCSASSSRSATAARSSRRSTWCRATRRGRASRS